jgi:hypothetical protein
MQGTAHHQTCDPRGARDNQYNESSYTQQSEESNQTINTMIQALLNN